MTDFDMGMAMRVKANGIQINYQIDGRAGAPWLIFSNSLITNLTMWDEQAAYFSKDYHVLRYDQRGHGGTEVTPGPYTFDILIDDVIGLMDVLEIKRASFCGLSMGGATAMGLAQRHGDRFDRVIVCDSRGASSASSAQEWKDRIGLAQTKGMAALADITLPRWFPPAVVAANPAYLAKVREMIITTPMGGFMGCGAALSNHDFRSTISRATGPILLIAGSEDGGGAVSTGMKQMLPELRNAKFVEMPGAGHISNMDCSELFNRTVADFLKA
jgi:3-oxoadipate enol-lactonase